MLDDEEEPVSEDENPLYDPASADYAAGRADQLSSYVNVDLAVASEAYRQGQQDERTAAVDAELLELAEHGEVRTAAESRRAAEQLGARPRRRDRSTRAVWNSRHARALAEARQLTTQARHLDARLAAKSPLHESVLFPRNALLRARRLLWRRRAVPALTHLRYWTINRKFQFGRGPAAAAAIATLGLPTGKPALEELAPRAKVDALIQARDQAAARARIGQELFDELDELSAKIITAYELQDAPNLSPSTGVGLGTE